MDDKMKMNKWTCRCAEHIRVEGAIEGSKEEVLAWMKARFPGLRETDGSNVELWYSNYKGGVQQYEIDHKDEAVTGSQYLYLVEKICNDTRDEARNVLDEMNAFAGKTPIGEDGEQLPVFLERLRSLGWTALTAEINKNHGKSYACYRLADPDSKEAIECSPLSQSLGACANPSGNWSHLRGADWSHLLQQQPQFADKCDWSKLDGYEWTALLIHQPQFADKCDWSKLDGTEWARLLVARPELTDRCDWDKLDARNWSMVLARRPELAGKFESAAHDWAADEKAEEAAAKISDEEAALCESEGIPAEEFFKES